MSEVEFANYIRRPKVRPETGLALAIRLLQVAPPKESLHAEVHGALLDLRSSAEALQDALRALHAAERVNLRPYDRRFDGAWAALYIRLQAWTRQLEHPKATRAQAVLTLLFPEGLAFLKLSYDKEWIHSRTLLALIDEQALETELAELAGPEFLPLIRAAHEVLGQMLGFNDGEAEDPEPMPDVVSRSRAVAQAIATYGRRMVGFVDEDDPKSVAMFMAAMAPRTAHLASMRRRASASEESAEAVEGEGAGEPEPPALLDEVDLDAPLPELDA